MSNFNFPRLAFLLLVVGGVATEGRSSHARRSRHHKRGHPVERDVSSGASSSSCSRQPSPTGDVLLVNLADNTTSSQAGHWQQVTTEIWIPDSTVSTVSTGSAVSTVSSVSTGSSGSTSAVATPSAVGSVSTSSTPVPTSSSSSAAPGGLSIGLSLSLGLGSGSSSTSVTSAAVPTSSSSPGTNSTSSSNIISTSSTDKHIATHFMLGIVSTYQQQDWEADIRLAQSKGIDSFACNIGVDSYTQAQLDLAYAAAEAVGNFAMFISFDFNWFNMGDVSEVVALLKRYINSPAQLKVDGKPFVSTFIGDGFAWDQVIAQVGQPLYIVPFWQPTQGNADNTDLSGLFSWMAWPGATNNVPVDQPMTDDRDLTYLGLTNSCSKVYMAPASSWFSTHFGNDVPYAKNWVFKSETLWYDRWEELLKMGTQNQLNFIELVTWNDYGESHYIGPYNTPHTDDGSSRWAAGLDHTAMLDFAVPYIKAFKAGASAPVIETDMLVYWYRPHLKSASCDATDNVGSRPTGYDFLEDTVFVASMTKAGGSVTVTSGSNAPVTSTVPAGVSMMEFPMGTGTQQFSLTTSGQTATGAGNVTISADCWNGIYNFNYHSGSITIG